MQSASGAWLDLESAWADEMALLVFVRHLGCAGCSLQMVDVAQRSQELGLLGVNTWIITPSPPSSFPAFIKRFGLDDKPLSIVSDPTLQRFEQAGMNRTRWGTVGPRALFDYVNAFTKGHLTGLPSGDLWQQGGVVLVDRGEVLWHRANLRIGDVTPMNEIIAQVLSIAAREKRK